MSKIVKAINAMISQDSKITQVIPSVRIGEFFFLFDGKHKWSIWRDDQNIHFLYFYPGNQSLEILASIDDFQWAGFTEMISYNEKDLGTREASSSLQELYTIVQEKRFNMDVILNEIIQTDEAPF